MKRPKIVCIIQARLTSTRFPKKVLEKINGKSMIALVCEAAREARFVDQVVVAWAHKFTHLDENDVLGRFREIALRTNADVIVRLTSDCPLLKGCYIDEAIGGYLYKDEYYFNNREHRNYWDGLDVQVMSKECLFDDSMTHKEHVISPLPKMSVDTPEDLERVRRYEE